MITMCADICRGLKRRLEEELKNVEAAIEAKKELPPEYASFKLVYDETKTLYDSGKYGDVHEALKEELGSICYRILENTAVFGREEQLMEFLKQAGFEI